MYDIIKYIKPITSIVSYTYIYTSLGVRMRSPMLGRYWIGWTDKEVAEHLDSVRSSRNKLPPPLPENGRGC